MEANELRTGADFQELADDMPASGYPAHRIALAFPPMPEDELSELADDIAVNGQQETIVLLDGHVLDGVHRQRGCLMRGVTPRFRPYDYATDGASPAAFVASRNLKRRQMSPSQKAAAAVDLLPFFEAEAKARQITAGRANLARNQSESTSQHNIMLTGDAEAKPRDEFDQPRGFDADGEPQARLKVKGKAAAHAAQATGASVSNVEKAKQLRDKDPKAFEDVKAGKKSLNAAVSGKPTKESKAAQEYDAALERIEKVCGKPQATAIREGDLMRNRKDVVAYAALSDAKMLAIRALIDQGWSVKKATLFKAENLLPTHTIRQAIHRAIYAGGAFQQKVHDESGDLIANVGVEVLFKESARRAAGRPT